MEPASDNNTYGFETRELPAFPIGAARKRRRRETISDEEIFDEIDRRVTYRIGWPVPLPVLPLVLEPIADESTIVQDIEEFRLDVAKILQAQRVVWDGRFFFAHHRKYDSVPELVNVSLIIPARGQGTLSWELAVKDIRLYFATKGIYFRIEIINFDFINPSALAILPGNPIIGIWESYHREKFLDLIQGKSWQSLDVLHLGHGATRDECPVTVVIHAWDAEEDDWWYDILPKLRLNFPLRIELFGAFDIMAMDVHASARTLSLDGFIGPTTPGASIGVKGESGGGTLGGILRFKLADGSTAQVGLTNHHVVQETQLAKETANGRPLKPTCSLVANASVEIMSPCDTDKVTRLEVIDNMIANSKKMVFGDGSQIGLQDQVSFGQTSKATALQKNIDRITQRENEKSQINSADRRLGHVVASSGVRTETRNGNEWAIDWALVKLTSNRPVTNTILGAIDGATDMFQWENDTVDEWAANGLTPGHIVSKKGRTTAWTDGEVSAIDTLLNITKQENGVDINPYGRLVTASPVTPVPGAGGNFCVSGDSGSLVIKTSDKKIVGLLFAGREQIGIGYVTPFDIIMEDIKNVTGWDIINPTKA